jgi:hypothetical protein
MQKNLVKKARIRNLNIGRITEQAPSSFLDYLKTQNREKTIKESPNFLVEVLS